MLYLDCLHGHEAGLAVTFIMTFSEFLNEHTTCLSTPPKTVKDYKFASSVHDIFFAMSEINP